MALAQSQRRPVTIEDIEDEDIQRMNTKKKLSSDSTYILEDDSDDEQIVFDRTEYKKPRKDETPKKHPKGTPKDIPIGTGKKYEHPRMPDIAESSVPALHSDLYKYKGPSQKEEVMLAVMDAHLNLGEWAIASHGRVLVPQGGWWFQYVNILYIGINFTTFCFFERCF